MDPRAKGKGLRLQSRTLDGIASYIKSGHARNIVVMTGAGISTSAGIPDFRSPDTGLYANLARLDLPYAEAVFAIDFFAENPVPFYTLAQELYPGKFAPTKTHSFLKLLHDKGLLLKLFTQNIDCLEREVGIPSESIVEAHGSFATQSCITCKKPYPDEEMKTHIAAQTIPRCKSCKGLVKPDIVFFGEQLPKAFFQHHDLPAKADLCIVLGTSLSVHPFASLPDLVPEDVPRLLINKEQVGTLGSRRNDVLYLGDCDDGCAKLAAACGWPSLGHNDDDEAEAKPGLDDEMAKLDKLTAEIDRSLKISRQHIAASRNLDHVFPHLKS